MSVNQDKTRVSLILWRFNALLIAAAALAASVISSEAQVYSQNVVGYYNVTIPSQKFVLFANQLVSGTDANQTNNAITSVFSGLGSDPNGVNNSVLYFWNGSGYNIWQYYSGADADYNFITSGSASGFYDSGGTLHSPSFKQGSGSFIYNPTSSNVVATVTGTVPQGTNVIPVITGFNIYSVVPPVATNLESALVGFPFTSDQNGVNNDVLYKWNGNGFNIWQYFTANDANYNFLASGLTTGFYDSGGTIHDTTTQVGQAFFLFHSGAPVQWTNSFSVQ